MKICYNLQVSITLTVVERISVKTDFPIFNFMYILFLNVYGVTFAKAGKDEY